MHKERTDLLQIKQKIAESAKINETRLIRMRAKGECLTDLKADLKNHILQNLSGSSAAYKEALKSLIVQGMIRLLEDDVELKVRKGEESLVQGLLGQCESEYSELMMRETGREYKTRLTVMEGRNLTVDEGSEYGGVILYAHERRIVVANTLMDRLNLVFEKNLPLIRATLFQE